MAFGNLTRFKGKPPWDLVKDDVVGKEIRAIVPQSLFKCMDDVFNYMRDLELSSDGSAAASGSGSHADQFVESFISVSPSGTVNIVLNCEPQGTPKGRYQFFTNEGVRALTPKAVLDWMYTVSRDGDTIVKSDGKEQIEISPATFLETLLVAAAKDTGAAAAVSPSKAMAPIVPNGAAVSYAGVAGSWTCRITVPNGNTVAETYDFQPQGSFSSVGQNTRLTGSYEAAGATVSLRILGATRDGITVASDAMVDLSVGTLTEQELRFDSVVRKSGTKRSSACVKAEPHAANTRVNETAGPVRQVQRGTRVSAGSVICLSVRSFHKVNAIEMTGNAYASLPSDCDHLGTDAAVKLLRTINDPVVGGVYMVGNAGGTVYVRVRDVH